MVRMIRVEDSPQGDVARAVAFLADPEQSAFVNGHTLSVDGSWGSLRRRKRGEKPG